MFYHNLVKYAPVVQRIERVTTDHKMWVRILPGVQTLFVSVVYNAIADAKG